MEREPPQHTINTVCDDVIGVVAEASRWRGRRALGWPDASDAGLARALTRGASGRTSRGSDHIQRDADFSSDLRAKTRADRFQIVIAYASAMKCCRAEQTNAPRAGVGDQIVEPGFTAERR